MVNFTEIIQTIKSLVETRIEMVKSDIQDQLVGMLSRLILLTLIGSILLFAVLFLSFSLAFYISQVTQSPYLGFLVVAICYLVVVVFLYLTKDAQGFQLQFNASLKRFIFNSPNRKNSNE
ncbi:MAG: phage holin family protein [Bacteroidetes bacterium]|nr:phage holin family protein [Bacteroidota bacterium]MDA1268627.1 phage holin family protein [Bacteroidota bacterium]